jgi:hypothetical protein
MNIRGNSQTAYTTQVGRFRENRHQSAGLPNLPGMTESFASEFSG